MKTKITGLFIEECGDGMIDMVADIVSLVTMLALKNARMDLVCPDAGPESVVRLHGRILGVRRFQANLP